MFVHTHNGLAFDKPVAEFEAGLGVEPAVPGVVGALTGVTRVLRSNRKTFKLSYGENYYYKNFALSQN